jgi:hypothetical protein
MEHWKCWMLMLHSIEVNSTKFLLRQHNILPVEKEKGEKENDKFKKICLNIDDCSILNELSTFHDQSFSSFARGM